MQIQLRERPIKVALLSINMKINQRLCALKTAQKVIDVNVCNVGAEVISESKMLTTALSLGAAVSKVNATDS